MKSRISWSACSGDSDRFFLFWLGLAWLYTWCAGMIMCDALFIAQIVLIFIFHVPWAASAAPWKHTGSHNSWSFIGECSFYRSNLISLSMSGGLWYPIYSGCAKKKNSNCFYCVFNVGRLELESIFLKFQANHLEAEKKLGIIRSMFFFVINFNQLVVLIGYQANKILSVGDQLILLKSRSIV